MRALPLAALGLLLVLVLMGVVGCVQVEVVNDRSTGRAHQDVGRVTSSDQNGSATIDVPVSLVPK